MTNYNTPDKLNAFYTVTAEVLEAYHAQTLKLGRLDAKYGQSAFAKKFFTSPKTSILNLLGTRYNSERQEFLQATVEDIEEGMTFSCPVSFVDHLRAVTEQAFS